MEKILKTINKMPWWVTNVYFLVMFTFLIWMLFFDQNNMLTSYNTDSKLNTLLDQKAYYETEIDKVNNLKEELFSTDEKKEKFAREKYLMKKDNEDLYIVVENQATPLTIRNIPQQEKTSKITKP